jgi:hypothetical protein
VVGLPAVTFKEVDTYDNVMYIRYKACLAFIFEICILMGIQRFASGHDELQDPLAVIWSEGTPADGSTGYRNKDVVDICNLVMLSSVSSG